MTSSIPEELRALPQWIVWRFEEREDKDGKVKRTKVPRSANGGYASGLAAALVFGRIAAESAVR